MSNNTSCKNCVFSEKNKGIQCGCLAQDISTFNIQVINNDYELIERYCQYRRSSLNGKSTDEALKEVRKQIRFNYTLFTDISIPSEAIDIYNSVYNGHGEVLPNKLVVFVGSYAGINDDIVLAVRGRPELNICVVNPVQLENIPGLVMSQKPNTSHSVYLDRDLIKDVHMSFFEWLDIQINDKAFRFKVLFGINSFIIPNIIYKTTELNAKEILKLGEKDKQSMSFKSLYDKFINFYEWDNGLRRFK